MKLVVGIVYTPFIPGGEELENAIDIASREIGSCARVVDAATDVLTLLDVSGEFDTLVLVAPSPNAPAGRYIRVEYRLPTKKRDYFEVVEDIRASMEGSLDVDDLVKALDAMMNARGEAKRVIVYKCGRGGCRDALAEALREAKRISGCEKPLGYDRQ